MNDFSGKSVAVLGFGVEGQSVAGYLAQQKAAVTVFDERDEKDFDRTILEAFQNHGICFIFGPFSDVSSYSLIVRSPGIKLSHPALADAQKNGAVITSATKLFFSLCPCPIIGVTGTKGKGTTSSLIYEMLKTSGKNAYLGGNIGTPPLTFLSQLTQNSIVVLELSSFQLQDLTQSPHIAVMLMVTSEHLDYHKDTHEYVEAKRNIVRFQTPQDSAILNRDYPASNESDIYTDGHVYRVSREQEVEEGCFVREGKIILRVGNTEEEVIDTHDILLPGKHNWENVCAAVMAATLAGVGKKQIVYVLKTFKGLEHRLELVATVQGVRYYDDSFSTTPETAMAAIEAFEDPEILIMGGSSKGSDFAALGQLITDTENIKAIIGIGKEWPKIRQFIKREVVVLEGGKDMYSIVKAASKIASLGDVVLLSPACASFDMFKNYKDRGEQFKTEVKRLKENQN